MRTALGAWMVGIVVATLHGASVRSQVSPPPGADNALAQILFRVEDARIRVENITILTETPYCEPPESPNKEEPQFDIDLEAFTLKRLFREFADVERRFVAAGSTRIGSSFRGEFPVIGGLSADHRDYWPSAKALLTHVQVRLTAKQAQLDRAKVQDCRPKTKGPAQQPTAPPRPPNPLADLTRPVPRPIPIPDVPDEFCSAEERGRWYKANWEAKRLQAQDNLVDATRYRAEVAKRGAAHRLTDGDAATQQRFDAEERWADEHFKKQLEKRNEADRIADIILSTPIVDCSKRTTGIEPPAPPPAPATRTSDASFGWNRSARQDWTLTVGARFEAGTRAEAGPDAGLGDETLAGLFLIAGALLPPEDQAAYLLNNPGVAKVLQDFAAALEAAALLGSASPDEGRQAQVILHRVEHPVGTPTDGAHALLRWPQGGFWRGLQEMLRPRIAVRSQAGRGLGASELWLPPSPGGQQPMVRGPEGERPGVKLFFTSLGRSSGESIRMTIVNDGNVPVRIALGALAVEPVEKLSERDVQRALGRLAGRSQATVTVEAYCLNFRKPPPLAGMVMRLADARTQARMPAIARIGEATRRLQARGALEQEGDPRAYAQQLLQWVIWTHEQRFDEQGFRRAFVEHARKNVAGAGRPWSRALEDAVSARVSRRWADMQAILREAAALQL